MMKQVELIKGMRVIRGWVDAMGTNGVPVTVGARVEVPGEGDFTVREVHDFSVARKEVKAMQDKARGNFTALKSYRGNK